jgi:4a-hydroxytetrahydrobiopterin dehydratase
MRATLQHAISQCRLSLDAALTNARRGRTIMAKLSDQIIRQHLATLKGWAYTGAELHKKYTFTSFMPAIDFVNKIAPAAETAGHHPDITINYNVVGIGLSTHSEGGVTDKDLDLAGTIDRIHSTLP